MREIEDLKIAKADEVLQILTAVIRQELTEEGTQLNPIIGKFKVKHKKSSVEKAIRAGSEP